MKSLRRFETVIIGGRADRPLRSDVRLGSYKNGGALSTRILGLGGFGGHTRENESWYCRRIHRFTVEGIREGNDMDKGYWVVAYRKVSDQEAVKEYAALLTPLLENFGGRMLVSPTSVVTAKEAGFEQMMVVIEFDSYEFALMAYQSDDHKKALAVLGSGDERDFRIVEGV